jgi:acetyl-CoA carboxylase carboxyl transferase subunit alpha
MQLGAVDEVIPEPLGGAHRDPTAAAANLREELTRALADLCPRPLDALLAARYRKYRGIGHYTE